jgi:uncharacterized protein YkwD
VTTSLPRARRALTAALLTGAFAVAVGACASGQAPPPAAPAAGVTETKQLTGMVNGFRNDNGASGLQPAYDATVKAQSLAQAMADQHRIFHSASLSAGIDPGWSAIAENVAAAPSLAEAQQSLQDSPGHRANLLGPYNQVGVGVAYADDGFTYVAEEFVAR